MSTLEARAAAAVAGDGTALAEVCAALTDPVFRICLRMLGSRRDAEDATQDILVKVITHLAEFEGRSSLLTWVHRIAVRHALGLRRSAAEERAVDLAELGGWIARGLASAPPVPSPEDRALATEIRLSCTQGMLLALARDERLAIVLVDVLGLDAAEAAAVAEVGHAALRKRLSRARERLEDFLRRTCGIANPAAPCRCELQVAGKRAIGASPERRAWLALVAPDDAAVAEAAAELRMAARVLRGAGLLAAPAALRDRLRALLPTLLA